MYLQSIPCAAGNPVQVQAAWAALGCAVVEVVVSACLIQASTFLSGA